MKVSDRTQPEIVTQDIALVSWIWIDKSDLTNQTEQSKSIVSQSLAKPHLDLLQPLRQLLENIKVDDSKFAKLICELIPAQCPFERDIKLFGHTLFHIPPMCKLNPLYNEVVGLRFRALCYLADECGEDVTRYC